METRSVQLERFLPIQMAAALAVVALVGVAFWQMYATFVQERPELRAVGTPANTPGIARTPYGSVNWQAELTTDTDTDTDPDGISNIAENVVEALVGSYVTLAETGSYTKEEGERIAGDIAESLRASISYPTYSADDLTTDTDTSYERMLAYRNDLREALEPLLANPGYELGIFANYIDTRDTNYLEQLRETAKNYRIAVEKAAVVIVPQDAVLHHVEILNALSEFGTVVERMSAHADDAFAAAALLRTYNDSEAHLMISFNTLASYFTRK